MDAENTPVKALRVAIDPGHLRSFMRMWARTLGWSKWEDLNCAALSGGSALYCAFSAAVHVLQSEGNLSLLGKVSSNSR